MPIIRNHYVLAVHDLDRSREWYQCVLGCEADEVDPGNWVFMRTGDVSFMLGRCPEAVDPHDLGDHSYFAYLVVDDVDAYHEHAKAAGADIMKAPTDEAWGMREMALRTVDGHRMMIATNLSKPS
ncbi:MAG: VOC family protein [Planctomycetota bacterium]